MRERGKTRSFSLFPARDTRRSVRLKLVQYSDPFVPPPDADQIRPRTDHDRGNRGRDEVELRELRKIEGNYNLRPRQQRGGHSQVEGRAEGIKEGFRKATDS